MRPHLYREALGAGGSCGGEKTNSWGRRGRSVLTTGIVTKEMRAVQVKKER